MEVAQDYIENGYIISKVLRFCKVPRSSFYYQSTGGKQGRKPYAKILAPDGKQVDSKDIVKVIEELFAKPFVDYGSYKTYRYLTDELGYSIGKHSVYTIMKNNGLTRKRYNQSSKKFKRRRVEDLIPQVQMPFRFMEFDIKFVWVAGKQRNIQVLTILDVHSRLNLGQFVSYNIKSKDVIQLFDKVITDYGLPTNFVVRCDNGSQFVAQAVQDHLLEKGIIQEFTKPSTPQQNAHIEAYHSVMERAVCQRIELNDKSHAKEIMKEFKDFYNFDRIHSGTEYTSPYKYLLQKEEEYSHSPSFLKSFLLVKQMYKEYLTLSSI